jgi:hypothetical protein
MYFQTFMTHAHKMDLRDMMDEVSQQLRVYESPEGWKQSIVVEAIHYKKLYFNPGLHVGNNAVST